jgi:hypothetical protein
MNTNRSAKRAAERRRSALIGALNSERTTGFALAFIAVLLMLNLILRFPDLGAIIAQYNQF